MKWDEIEGQWEILSVQAKAKWEKLTADDLERVAGRRDELVERVRELYEVRRVDAETDVHDWGRHLLSILKK